MRTPVYDLAIVGGGPAGCSAGIRAARLGLRAILFESRTYPHDKLCGEFLSPECRGMLDELGVGAEIWSRHPHPITQVCLTAADGSAWETALPGGAWGLSRHALDATLADRAAAAGVVVKSGTTVDRVLGSLKDCFTLEAHSVSGRVSTIARTVIAAHGKRSTLDRVLNRRFLQRRQPFVALKTHFTGIPLPGRVELHTFPGGYCGFSWIEAGLASEPVTNVCFLAREDVFQNARQAGRKPLESFLEWMRAQNPYIAERLSQGSQLDKDWISIAQVPFTPKSPLEGDLMMAGDAAGLIVPLAGDGISMALRSGILAADSIFQYLDRDTSPAWLRKTYSQTWKGKFGRRLALGRLLQKLILHPPLASASLRLIHQYPFLGQYLIIHTREVNKPNVQ
jgi:flavin-dependent dehydrogenase